MGFLEIYSLTALIIVLLVTGLWLISLWLKDASIVDVFWGSGFVVASWVYFALTPDGFDSRKWLVVILVTLWGLRLSLYILWRNWGEGEDARYQKFRANAGEQWWWQSYVKVFLLQGFLMWLISAPLLAAQISPTPANLTVMDYLAVIVWLIGFFFEAVGDWQLARFKADPANKGQLLTSGVWRYTRHPNYFGDATQWWAYYFFAVAAGSWWFIYSPILMTFLIIRVSGVALLENNLKQAKPGYEDYIRNTSAFIPWFPKNS